MMNIREVQQELAALAHNQALRVETNLGERAKAFDFIALVDEIARVRGKREDVTAVQQQARHLEQELNAINQQFFQKIRRRLQTADRHTLRAIFEQVTPYKADPDGPLHLGQDGLDILVNALLHLEQWPPETEHRTTEMVQLETTPARAILDLVDHAGITTADVFYDLGSGLGQVAVLVHLLTGIPTRGVEFEPAYCTYAQARAQALGLTNVQFFNGDAQTADYTDGTIFFMFTPFRGHILQTVLRRLEAEAQQRPIKICTYGTCTLEVAAQAWLHSPHPGRIHEFKLAIFASHLSQ